MRVNPLKSLRVMELGGDGNSSEPEMTWTEAAEVAAILAFASYFLYFLLPYGWGSVVKDVGAFIWESFRFLGSAFFANFLSLTGLAKLVEKRKK